MVKIVRVSDLVGEFGKNEIVVLLPFTPPDGARRALRRCLELLYMEPLESAGISFTIKMAGVAINYHAAQMPDAKRLIKEISNELMKMEISSGNIQNLIR
jgi:GGDEF domain-containing protein